MDWDEGPDVGGPHEPYYQSQRLDRYRAMADRLVAEGHAYFCYCSTDTLQSKRQAAEAAGGGWMYDRTCRNLGSDEIAQLEAAGAPRAVRFLVPEGETAFDDLVHGAIRFDNANVEDFVVLRSDRQPTYHLSVVADDIDMGITHVIRGDDHISNTPKQVLLYQAFGQRVPAFAHVPLILGTDKKRLSKRHGATSVTEYQRMGYLPQAMVNFLALLGWSPGNDRELLSRDELIAAFALENISGGNAVFNPEKLDWMNQQYIMRLSAAELGDMLQPLVAAADLWRDDYAQRRTRVVPVPRRTLPAAIDAADVICRRGATVPFRSPGARRGGGRETSVEARTGRADGDVDRDVPAAACLRKDGTRNRAARDGGAAWAQGWRADPRDESRRDRPRGQSRPVRGPRTARPRAVAGAPDRGALDPPSGHAVMTFPPAIPSLSL